MKALAATLAALILAGCAARDSSHERALRELKPITHEGFHHTHQEFLRALEDGLLIEDIFTDEDRRALERLEAIKWGADRERAPQD